MNSSSGSNKKRPDIDRVLIMREIKARMKELRAMRKQYAKSKKYMEAGQIDTLFLAYDYIYNRINRGIYDVMPKVKRGP